MKDAKDWMKSWPYDGGGIMSIDAKDIRAVQADALREAARMCREKEDGHMKKSTLHACGAQDCRIALEVLAARLEKEGG